MKKTILVTGGTGYIGSHTSVELINKGYNVIIFDNLSNSSPVTLDRIEKITGKRPEFIKGDIVNLTDCLSVLTNNKIDAVIHFAGLKAVGESSKQPLRYYENNVCGTVNLLKAMKKTDCKTLIFSSSATVYGNSKYPYKEEYKTGDTANVYGTTKYTVEVILRDLCAADDTFTAGVLRYFNPIGAHESGLIGEDPKGVPNNIAPYITQVIAGKLPYLNIYGNDYPTVDGTGVRDYIDVNDLAIGHIAALEKITAPGFYAYNLGSGKGTSVLELVAAFEKACGKKIPYKFAPRRPGDLPEYYASAEKAFNELGFKTTSTVEKMCASHWNWQKNNPDGYGKDN